MIDTENRQGRVNQCIIGVPEVRTQICLLFIIRIVLYICGGETNPKPTEI